MSISTTVFPVATTYVTLSDGGIILSDVPRSLA